MKQAASFFDLGVKFERIFFFMMISIMATHISSCLWIFFSQLASEDDVTWMDGSIKDLPLKEQYLTAFYFTITTFSTVGYGDISANNPYE